jgi:hypothetical protein
LVTTDPETGEQTRRPWRSLPSAERELRAAVEGLHARRQPRLTYAFAEDADKANAAQRYRDAYAASIARSRKEARRNGR